MTGFRVVLDACVLVPIHKADLLLTFAEHHAYSPHWSERILDETVSAIPAVRGSAAAIVTDNDQDFPREVLEHLGLHTRTSDQFLLDLMGLNKARAVACVAQTADKRRNPPVTTEEYLDALARAGAVQFAREIAPLFESGS